MAGDGLDVVALVQQQIGDVAAGVAGGAGYGVQDARCHRGFLRVASRVACMAALGPTYGRLNTLMTAGRQSSMSMVMVY